MEQWTTPELVPLANASDAQTGFVPIDLEEFDIFPIDIFTS